MPTSISTPISASGRARPAPVLKHRPRAIVCLALAAIVSAAPVAADETEEGIVVSATRTERRNLDIPGSIDAVGAQTLECVPQVACATLHLEDVLGRYSGERP